jgi:pimeloyl-ACP methyl ester carboxylesterase
VTLEILSHKANQERKGPPLLFVHGAYTAAWCWENFLPWFARRGYDAHAVSLRGHGASPVPGSFDFASVDDYVADVLEAADGLGEPPVLIGHSMGAIVVQRAALRARAPAMALLAPVPPHGLTGSAFTLAARDPPLFLALNTMQLANGGAGPDLIRVRDYLFSQTVTEADARRHLMRMQRESSRALADLAWPQHFWIAPSRGVRALVIGAGRDAFFPPPMIEETARFHGVTPVMFEDMAHALMLEPGWRRVAEALRAWLET